MNFKNITQKAPALRYLLENTQTVSEVGGKLLLSSPFYLKKNLLESELENISVIQIWYFKLQEPELLVSLIHTIQDFSGTIKRLRTGQILDDLDYFEIKKGSLMIQSIKEYLEKNNFPLFKLDSLQPVIHILDPENSNLPHFYIYSAYDDLLKEKRKEYDQCKEQSLKDQLFLETLKIEDQIRRRLAISLRQYAPILETNLNHIAHLDLWIAKAKLAQEWNCCRPTISNGGIQYKGLFHPVVKDRLTQEGKLFQALDIDLKQHPTLITGANMSGKTIFLKSIAFAQWMFQLGYFVPAQEATLELVEEILLSFEDTQSEMNGLSSFAAEILNVNHIIQEVKKGKKLLILVDELARTTNPVEGSAFVTAFMEIMTPFQNVCLVTTHYSGIKSSCRRLRVKGLQIDGNNEKITPQNINQFMDYALEESDQELVPHEAITIAEIFNVDEDFITLSKQFLKQNK